LIDIIVIAGATASGKTALGIELAKALSGEVVSADSMQIYRGMDIGTAKPTAEERQSIVHHMIDIVEPCENYSAADFVRDADRAIEDIASRGKVPIIVGGTGLYLDCLTGRRTLDAPRSDEKIRAELTELCEREGIDALYEVFLREAPSMEGKIHKNDVKRVMRAIEKARSGYEPQETLKNKRYNSLWFAIDIERKNLYNRIDERVDKMISRGLESEVRRVLLPVRDKNPTALQAIGYKEMISFIDGSLTLSEAAELIKKRSRNYAKRQLTWFRRNEEIHMLTPENAFDEAVGIIKKRGR